MQGCVLQNIFRQYYAGSRGKNFNVFNPYCKITENSPWIPPPHANKTILWTPAFGKIFGSAHESFKSCRILLTNILQIHLFQTFSITSVIFEWYLKLCNCLLI